MTSVNVAGGAAVLVFVSGLVGLFIQSLLPESHTSDRSRDIIGGVVGLLTLLLALVLGLLIWTAYGVTNTQKNELQLLSARALEFDLEMKQYGPEAEHAREMMRTEIVWAHEQFWGDASAMANAQQAVAGDAGQCHSAYRKDASGTRGKESGRRVVDRQSTTRRVAGEGYRRAACGARERSSRSW